MKNKHIPYILSLVLGLFVNLIFAQGGKVVISEVYFDTPYTENLGELNHHAGEYIELFNSSNEDIDISGWYIKDNILSFKFPIGTIIKAGGFKVITPTKTKELFISLFPEAAGHEEDIILQNMIYLNNHVEKVELWDRYHNLQYNMSYYPVGWISGGYLKDRLNKLKKRHGITTVYGFTFIDNSEIYPINGRIPVNNTYGIGLTHKDAFYGGIPNNQKGKISKMEVKPFDLPIAVPLLDVVEETQLSEDQNYVHQVVYQKPLKEGELETASYTDKIQNVTYYDGLGRPKQEIAIRASPDEKDVITHIEYDMFGRQSKEYLPFKSERVMLLAGYKPVDEIMDINHYYQNKYPEDFEVTNVNSVNPYSERI